MNVGQLGLHRSLWQKEEMEMNLELADHMKGYQVGGQTGKELKHKVQDHFKQ